MEGTTKVFTLTASNVQWEVSKGQFVDAMAFNGQIPGPQIDVAYGDHIKIVVENQLDQPTVVHYHGMTVPNAQDGVPYITQPPIMPGQFWTYAFTVVDPPGMYVYHSHFNSTEQVGSGLYRRHHGAAEDRLLALPLVHGRRDGLPAHGRPRPRPPTSTRCS